MNEITSSNGMRNQPELSTFATLVLGQINHAVEASGDVMEGNLFYHHQKKPEPAPDPSRQHKRKNFLIAIEGANNLLEIGFNAGHSALLALSSSPTLTYLGVDIASNKYSRPCAELIERHYPGRAKIIFGDSRIEVPRLALSGVRPDVIHVDGGHDDLTAELDILHAIQMVAQGGIVIVDDTHHPPIRAMYEEVVRKSYAEKETFSGQWIGEEAMALRVKASQFRFNSA